MGPTVTAPAVRERARAQRRAAAAPGPASSPDAVPTTQMPRAVASAPPAVRLGAPAADPRPGGPGQALLPSVRPRLERIFGVDLGGVRVHTEAGAAAATREAAAKAMTIGSDIFLGPGQRDTDVRLLAHEIAHVVQQRQAPAVQLAGSARSDPLEQEAERAASAAARNEPVAVTGRVNSTRTQRWGVSDALNSFADKANMIPGFRMFTIALGVNPINMSRVERSAANILRALIEFMPGGGLITQALDNSGVFEKAGAFVEQQVAAVGLTGAAIKAAIMEFIDSLSLGDIFDLGGVWDRAKRIFTDPIDRLIQLAKNVVNGIIELVKDAILRPLAALAAETRGWDLLTAVLGKNPITGDAVPRNADTLIGGFMKLINQTEVWENMKKANAIGRAWAWFQGAMGALMGFVSEIPSLAINAFKSLELFDIVLVPRAIIKVGRVFANFLGRFITWAGNAVWNLLEIIFDVVSPGAWGYIKKTGGALRSILRNPLPFLGNLVKAAKQGFLSFAGNFLTHLKAGLINWLTGSLPGVYIPKSFDLKEIVKFVLSVLGLSWANVRQRLVAATSETIVKALETTFDIVVTLVRDGPAAAWEKIKEQLSNLKDMVIGAITDFVVDAVVKKAIPKLVAMFIPGAGFIGAILSIYDTVMVFVNRISQIIQVVRGFIDSIVAIAGGQIAAAAKRVESILANLLSLAIAFLAGFAGLGKVADKIMGVIGKIRAPIDKAIDFLVKWIVTTGKKLFAAVFGRKDRSPTPSAGLDAAVVEAETAVDQDPNLEAIGGRLMAIQTKYGLRRLTAIRIADDTVRIEAEINPRKSEDRKLTDKQRLEKCVASRKHGKRVEMVGHGDPKAAAAKAKDRLAQLRRSIADFRAEIGSLEIRIQAQERLARARGVPENQIPALTEAARRQIRAVDEQIRGAENNVVGIEHEEKVAKVDKAILRNLKVRCTICKAQVTELDQISDPGLVLEAKASAAAVSVDQVLIQQRAIDQLFGGARRLVLALPLDVDRVALQQKFEARGVPVPPIRTY